MAASRAVKIQRVKICFLLLCAIGIFASLYAYHVEVSKERDGSYKAMCDISAYISCSKVFTSRYGRGFGILDRFVAKDSIINQPNSVFGLAFYTFHVSLAFSQTPASAAVQIGFSVVANLGSIYLAYILYFILQDFCVVCVSMYVINALILATSIIKFKILVNQVIKDSKKKRG
ncbi:vitamin K epoxide reductase complex subunit 1-like protein 1 [Liolophura sinensis]|uniref:vitamin K epoxide reductase complex subunit 1-like protein 1 n=1 Tax=Liolophura sinensis TaxID=3198878 RepID=UPI00315933A7